MSEGSVFIRGDGRVCAVYKDAKVLVLLTMVALMVALSIAPAFAAWDTNGCRGGDHRILESAAQDPVAADKVNGRHTDDALVCEVTRNNGTFAYYDNRPV